MRELSLSEIETVSGAGTIQADWGEVGAGLGMIALGVAVAVVAPEALLVWCVGTELSFWGSYITTDGFLS